MGFFTVKRFNVVCKFEKCLSSDIYSLLHYTSENRLSTNESYFSVKSGQTNPGLIYK